jgi:protein JSN1
MWEVAQGRFGARSMRACLESPHITLSQQRRIATAVILNSIPLATNPNGALLLTWLLDSSGFPSRYKLLAPRFTPHLSHLCTHKLASLTVLRIINQKIEHEASCEVVDALFSSPSDHVLTDVLGDQVNGVAVVHKILTSPFIDPAKRPSYIDATKRVLIELKVIATQAYRRLIEEVGLPVPSFQPAYPANVPQTGRKITPQGTYSMPGLPSGYPSNDQGLASMMAALQMGGQNPHSGPPQLHIDPGYAHGPPRGRGMNLGPAYVQTPDHQFNPFGLRSPEVGSPKNGGMRRNGPPVSPYGNQSPSLPPGNIIGMGQPSYPGMGPPQSVPPHVYQAYMYQGYPHGPPTMGAFHA